MDKRYKMIDYIMITILLLLTLTWAIFNYQSSRLVTYFAVIPLVIIPFIFDKIIYETTEKEKIIYYIFIFFAYFLGCVVNLYNKTEYYDLIMHGISGIYTCIMAFIMYDKFKIKNSPLVKFIFCFGFVFLVAGLWEIGEFSSDYLFHTNLQHSIETGVVDTMSDMISATIGAIIVYVMALKIN